MLMTPIGLSWEDKFIKLTEKSVTKNDKTISDLEVGWYSKADMSTILKWSSFLTCKLKKSLACLRFCSTYLDLESNLSYSVGIYWFEGLGFEIVKQSFAAFFFRFDYPT